MGTNNKIECNITKNCKNCDYPCINQGEDLKPITTEELSEMGYIICDDYTEEYEEPER